MTDNISLNDSMKDLEKHTGNVWTHIISLRREDAQRLSYDNVDSWINLVRSKNSELAKHMKIKPENLVWYGAYHDEGHHPHIHLMAYSKKDSEGYLTNFGINQLRGSFAKDIFKQDLISVYAKQTTARDSLKQELVDALAELESYIQNGTLENEKIHAKFLQLVKNLEQLSKGKKTYGYLPKPLKADVDELLDLFADEESVANCYDEWNKMRQEVLDTYTEKELETLPLSQQKEFVHLKNVIIKSAVEFSQPTAPKIKISESENIPVILPNSPLQLDIELETNHVENIPADTMQGKHIQNMWSTNYKQCRKVLFNDKDFVKAHGLLVAECKKENPLAYSDLARLYADGLGVEINPEKAYELYSKSLELFIKHTQHNTSDYLDYRIGKMYLYGLGTGKNYEQSVDWLERAVSKGNKYAEYTLGMLYMNGTGVEKNIEVAMELLKSSADKKNPYAEYQYGLHLKNTLDTPTYNRTGARYLSSAFRNFVEMEMESEDDNLSYRIGKMLEQGLGIEKDNEQALKYYKKSALLKNPYAVISVLQQSPLESPISNDIIKYIEILTELSGAGNESATYYLGKLLEDGQLLEKDDAGAVQCYEKIALANPYASYRLGNLLLESQQIETDTEKGIHWLSHSAEHDNPYAQYKLATILLSGELVEQSIPLALSFLEKASIQGNEPACYLLGKIYEQGELVEKDDKKAFKLYSLIAEKNQYASYSLGRLILDSSQLELNKTIGIYWLEKSAEQGNENSWYRLGKEYLNGEPIGFDIDKALFYLEKSTETNNSFALYQLAKIHLYGIGVSKDESIGMDCLLESIRLGNVYAEDLLNHYRQPKETLAFSSIFRSFHFLFSSPPANTGANNNQPIVDRKLRSKIKRKKMALGHKDEMSMK